MVKSGKSQDKNADKTFKNKSRLSVQVLKVSFDSFHTFTQISNFQNAIFNAEHNGWGQVPLSQKAKTKGLE